MEGAGGEGDSERAGLGGEDGTTGTGLAVAVPRILYAADVFLNPGPTRRMRSNKAGWGGRAVVRKLAAIQRRAAILITGAMRTTAGDVLDAHANLMPMRILIDKLCCRAALRLATLLR